MHTGRGSKGLLAENTPVFWEGATSSQLWAWRKACSRAHVQEDIHVCTLSQGPVLTWQGGTFPRPGEEEEGDAISRSLPAPPATGTTPHTSTEPLSPRLGKLPLRNSQHTPPAPQQRESHAKPKQNKHQNQKKPTTRFDGSPKGEQQSPVLENSPSPGLILHPLPLPAQGLSTGKDPKSWKNPPNEVPSPRLSQRSQTPTAGQPAGMRSCAPARPSPEVGLQGSRSEP